MSPSTWFTKTWGIDSSEAFVTYCTNRFLKQQSTGECLTLVIQNKPDGQLVATSTYHHADPDFTKVEIGFTWIGDQWQRSFVNTEMKFLMLEYAFEVMKVKRVEFVVHPNNEKSNVAMKRIGAVFEGTLRKWRFRPGSDDGDRSIYSVIDDEWPSKKIALKKLLGNY